MSFEACKKRLAKAQDGKGPAGGKWLARAYVEGIAANTSVASLSGRVAGFQALSPDEERVEALLRERVTALPDTSVQGSFLDQKPAYDSSALLKLLRHMPKGAVLHTHGIATGDFRELARRLKASDGKAWTYVGEDKRGPPDFLARNAFRWQAASPGEQWARADTLTADEIYALLTLPPGLDSVERNWEEFMACWDRLTGIMSCVDFYYGEGGYLWHILEEQVKAGVSYVEIKEAVYATPKRLDGTVVSDAEWIAMFKDTVDAFKASHRGFLGARVVATTLKLLPEAAVREHYQRTLALKAAFPEHIAGFDLAGPEDGPGTSMFSEALEEERAGSQEAAALPLLTHAGETNIPAARQVAEAVTIGCCGCRIGHGFALARWPHLFAEVAEKGMCLEVCPISNQVLGYYPDLTGHPAPMLLRSGVPLTISPDDPGMWHYCDVSYDWAAAAKAWNLNLAELRAMAKNSIEHSTLAREQKTEFLATWEAAWRRWIASALNGDFDL